ncbi:MAG: YhbY family RNA-binding protein, partial [SAR324 cluster bacterium]|nr:YhbY family RNA-binding protein [SAR324 cluster bacterium]
TLVQIEKQLDDHELIKVRVLEASPQDHRECNQALEKNESFEVVQLIGKSLVLYRPRPEKPSFQIPD